MAAQGFFQNAEAHHLRQMAIFNIKQLVETPGLDYDPFVPFLALTYFDRCASWHPIPDDLEFLTTFVYGCTVLAWKMRSNTEFTRFKPSIIAAVGVVAERSEKEPPGDSCIDPILRCKFVDMDEFENCIDLLMFKRATEIANAALIPRIDFPESPLPPAQQEEQEEEEEAEEITNAAVIHGGGRGGRKRRRVVMGEKAEVLSYGRASVNPF
ncbi:hypothetical protein RHGRI_009573 [Rhododendron griersonianum]|uniref:Cyclin N-terminal domain-containing protein n=1 Tax=Rhododendron griersonianum TaxID=479676 RepID=A0AAV6KFH6_9ERIC|nr:hypothetical protein RHGRI_009573 [Rhododendron griersonianum]